MSGTVVAETLRRHLASPGYIAFLMLLTLTGLFASSFATPGSMWPALVSLLAIITGSAIVGPEFSTGTLQLIVSKPIRRSVYLLSRVAGVFAAVTLAGLIGLGAEIAGRLLRSGAAVPWLRLVITLGGTLTTSLLAIALLTFLGSLTRAYFNVAIYIGTEASLSATQAILATMRVHRQGIGAILEEHPAIEATFTAVDDILFASATEMSAEWLARVGVTIAVALLLACMAFERREVPYGSD